MRIGNSYTNQLIWGIPNYNPVNLPNVNKVSDVANQIFNIQSTQYASFNAATKLQSDAKDLKNIANQLSGSNLNNTFSARTASTTNENAATATITNNTTLKDYTVNVQQIATGQENKGKEIKSTGNDFAASDNAIKITVNGKETNVNIKVEGNKTNAQALSDIAKQINDQKLGVNASVETDVKAGTSKIVLKAATTGENATFKIEDVTGKIVQSTGADIKTTDAQNAKYSINGGNVIESTTNKVKADNGVTVTLTGKGEAKIGVQYDKTKISDNAKTLVNELNSFLKTVRDNSDNLSASVQKTADNLINNNKKALENIGIQYDSSKGEFKISDNFNKLLDNRRDISTKVESTLENVASRISKVATAVEKAPTSSIAKIDDNYINQNFGVSNSYSNSYMNSSLINYMYGRMFNAVG